MYLGAFNPIKQDQGIQTPQLLLIQLAKSTIVMTQGEF